MAIVNGLRLSQQAGAIISDEETWLFGRRRLFISDSMASLLTAEMADRLQMEVLFAGIGNISLVHEVIFNVKSVLEKAYHACEHLSDFAYPSVGRIAGLCNQEFQKAIRRRVNNIIQFRYGFDLASFHRGYLEDGGKKVEIKQKKVLDDCMSVIEPAHGISDFLKPIYENEALIAGWDKRNGFQIIEIDGRSQERFLSPSVYCNLGRGADSGAIVLADLVNSKTLEQRRQGFDKIEGLIELIHSANVTSTFNNQVGGYFSIVIIDGAGTRHSERFTEITDHEARLAGEIVMAYKAELIEYQVACDLMRHLLDSSSTKEAIEKTLFVSARNPRHLDLLLRGYKIPSIDKAYLQSSEAYPIFEVHSRSQVLSSCADEESGGNEVLS